MELTFEDAEFYIKELNKKRKNDYDAIKAANKR